ncbi:MAG: hypothetical protein HGB35_08870, partial [Geobacteraceae bacterium]|nr:hypothetical protein [Geobacteraceae bacterium]
PKTYEYGLVTNIPWLYYWVMGKLLHLNFFGMSDLVFLRVLNIPLAFGTVYYAWRTLRLLTDDKLPQILLIVAMTNTPMFSFLSASVSYDNLTNLLAAMSVYFLLAFFNKRSGNLLAVSFVCQLAGCLTKYSLLPLVLVLNLILLIHEFKTFYLFPSACKEWFRASWKRGLGLSLAIIIGLVLNIQLYGGNYFRYGKLAPEMAKVLSFEIAMQYRIEARNMIFTLFKEGRISKGKAFEMAVYSDNSVGDSKTTIYLIENYDYLKKSGAPIISPVAYIPIWMYSMFDSIFGIYAHLGMPAGVTKMWLFSPLIALAVIAFLYRWRPRESGWTPAHLAVISGFYAVFLMYAVNYLVYLEFRAPGLTLQGRYLFPVIGPAYVLLSYYLIQLAKVNSVRLVIFALASLLFIIFDFPWFLAFATPDWFTGPSL